MVGPPPAPGGGIDIQYWLDAAADFTMNTDFDVASAFSRGRLMDLKDVMQVMKDMSTGKKTIQALADKLMLHRILENMDVPQMPALKAIDGMVSNQEMANFVHTHLCGPDSPEVVIKPTHLSNGMGVIVVSRPKPEEVDSTINFLTSHINQFLTQKAGAHESVALRSLKPGFIVQPKYMSQVHFKTPLELRVIVLWGHARLAIWWWGRGAAPGEFPHRNAWLVRRPRSEVSQLSEEDEWQVIHEHTGSNPGFDKALELFQSHITAIAAVAEALAVAVGAPFLRSDFFVGSSQWGVRLNEVAYGCGVDYRNQLPDGRIVDDAPAIARILQEGMSRCHHRLPADNFLKRLGVKGQTYADMSVTPLPAWVRPPLPTSAYNLGALGDPSLGCPAIPEELCRTMHPVWQGGGDRRLQRGGRSRSWDERGAAEAAGGSSSYRRGSFCQGNVRSNSFHSSAQHRWPSPAWDNRPCFSARGAR